MKFRLTHLAVSIIVSTVLSNSSLANEHPYTIAEYALPKTLDPILMNDEPSLIASNLIYDGLVKFSPNLTIESAIAESWTTSLDGKTITFILRKDAKFHNGEKIEAKDVTYSLSRLSSSKSIVKNLYDCIQSVKEISPEKVSINLKWPYPPVFGILAGATSKILPMKYADQSHFFDNPIGSGAYKTIKIDEQEKTILFEANNQYYLATPKLSSIILKEVSTEDEAKKLAKERKIDDLTHWPLTGNDSIFNYGQKFSSPVFETWIIGMVTNLKPFNDTEIRKSFRASFDQEKFRKKFYPDANPAWGYIPLGVSGSRSVPIKKEQVGKISKMPIHIAIPKELSNSVEMKIYIENEFKSLGWNVTVDLTNWDELIGGYSTRKFQSFLLSMNMDYPDADFLLKNFESNNKDNFSAIKDAKLDKAIIKMRTINDKSKRLKAYEEAINIIDDLALTINVFHPKANSWVSKCVRGFEANLLSNVYIDYRTLHFDEACAKDKGKIL